MNIGKTIRKLRRDRELSLRGLGEKVGVSGTMIIQYESDRCKPSAETLERLCELFETPEIVLLLMSIEEKDKPAALDYTKRNW